MDDEAPAEHYIARWDGNTLFVGWEMEKDAYIPMSGGHIVAEVLRDTVRKLGYGFHIQACNAGCDYMFTHTTILAEGDLNTDDTVFKAMGRPAIVLATVEVDENTPEEVLESIDGKCRLTVEIFGRVKNCGQRLAQTEELTRSDLDDLLTIWHRRGSIALHPARTIAERWQQRGWRRQTRRLIARLWLALSNMETLKRIWADQRFKFESGAKDDDELALFERDHLNDVSAIESLDLSMIQAAVEQASARLDNRGMIIATSWGAVAGALAGTFAALLQSH